MIASACPDCGRLDCYADPRYTHHLDRPLEPPEETRWGELWQAALVVLLGVLVAVALFEAQP